MPVVQLCGGRRQWRLSCRGASFRHTAWDSAQAERQNAFPPGQRGQSPLIGACHPARRRNSAVTATHAPAWLAEEADLTAMLRQTRLAPPRKQALQQRLAGLIGPIPKPRVQDAQIPSKMEVFIEVARRRHPCGSQAPGADSSGIAS